jgi:hypothetical protein
MTKLTYIAGIWVEHFPYELLWYCETLRIGGKSSVAPTWSWASRRGPVRMLFANSSVDNGQAQQDVGISGTRLIHSTHDAVLIGTYYQPAQNMLRPRPNVHLKIHEY